MLSSAAMLNLRNLTCRLGGRPVLDGASAQLSAGRRVGLVGRNGAGKSTLLRLILGEMAPDGGTIELPPRWRVGTVAQEAPRGDASLLDVVLAADSERTALLAEADTATDPARIAEVHERLATIEAHRAPARAAAILAGLGFDDAAQARAVGDFSGGWRMRVALAAALFSRADLLLLDEPTNHLDLEAALWLEGFLASYPGTLLLVSHDRDILNRVVDAILHLENGRLTLYSGGYDRFERTRRENLARLAAQNAQQTAERQRIQSFVDRFRAKATKARQAQSRLKMLERMEPITPVAAETVPRFVFPEPDTLPPPLVTMEKASVGYATGKPVLRNLDLRIDMDDRIALLGANGNGKTTMLRLIAGGLPASGGHLMRARKLEVGYFAQDQLDLLDTRHTAVQSMAALMGDAPEEKVRAHLGRFGFGQDKADVHIANLSGGEKARLVLARVCRGAPQLLLLDEPTNHLDLDAREALIQALNEFAGAVILVTHDPHLVELVADRLWLVGDGTCRSFEGDMQDYRELLAQQRRDERRAQRAAARPDERRTSKQDERRARAEARSATQPLRDAVRRAERDVERLAAEIARLDADLADPALYAKPSDRLAELTRNKAGLQKSLAAAEDAWLAAQTALEDAEA
ncbi:MAG: ABC-F family ATP-binding cassette domain-containing protein [Alphaproteobacteria bacterium]